MIHNKSLLIIADFVYPNYMGGSAVAVYDFIKWLYKNNKEFILITRKPSGRYSLSKADTDTIFFQNLKAEGKCIEVSLDFKLIIRIVKMVKNHRYIIIHHPILGIIPSLLVTKGQKLFYHFHGPYASEYSIATGKRGIRYFVRNLMQKICIRKSQNITVYSNYMARLLRSLYLHNKIIKIKMPIDIEKYKPAKNKLSVKEELGLPLDKIILFTSRRLTKRTGIYDLVQHFAEINRYFNNTLILIVAGKGEMLDEIRKIDAPNVKIIGFVPETELIEYYQASDIYVLPTIDLEGFGKVILEAFACGVPVIGSNQGAISEIIGNIDKELLFNFSDIPESLIKAIEHVITKTYIQKSEFFRKIAEEYCSDDVCKEYYNIIMEND